VNADLAAGLEEQGGVINGLVGAWHDFGYEEPPTPDCKTIPPLGERSAQAIRSGHKAIGEIDDLIRKLHRLREQLVGELRQDSDIRGRRVDAMIAESTAVREDMIGAGVPAEVAGKLADRGFKPLGAVIEVTGAQRARAISVHVAARAESGYAIAEKVLRRSAAENLRYVPPAQRRRVRPGAWRVSFPSCNHPPLPVDEAEIIAAIAELARLEQSGNYERAPILIGPFSAYILIAVLQLAWRHPDLSDTHKSIIEQIAKQLQPLFGPPLDASIELGWRTEFDQAPNEESARRSRVHVDVPADSLRAFAGMAHDTMRKDHPANLGITAVRNLARYAPPGRRVHLWIEWELDQSPAEERGWSEYHSEELARERGD
jgi:hypothetical protein